MSKDKDQPTHILTTPFKPQETDTINASKRQNWLPWILLGIPAACVLFTLFFLTNAQSIGLMIDSETPVNTEISGFHLNFGSRVLILPGDYKIRVEAEGYNVYSGLLSVNNQSLQTFEIKLAPLPGFVSIISQPPGAEVFLNENSLGVTPLNNLSLPAGSTPLEFRLPRYQESDKLFTVTGRGIHETLTISLAPDWADFEVQTIPNFATFRLNGKPLLRSLGTLEIPSGEHVLAIEADGYRSIELPLAVVAGTKQNLGVIQLTPADGKLRVSSQPLGASLALNGKFIGSTPIEFEVRPDTEQQISLNKPGYERLSQLITLKRGEARELKIPLKPLMGRAVFNIAPDDAKLIINGKLQGYGSLSMDLPAMKQQINVRKEGYAEVSRTIQPRPGFTQEIYVSLKTEAEARKDSLSQEITSAVGHTLRLIDPVNEAINSLVLGTPRRDPGRGANEVEIRVLLDRAFYIATMETTNAQFRLFTSNHDSGQIGGQSLNREKQPAVGMSWQQAASFCNWLSEREGLPPFYSERDGIVIGFNVSSKGYRLPTEAEWAFVSRVDGNDVRRFAWGDDWPPRTPVSNLADVSSAMVSGRVLNGYQDNYVVTAPVASFPPNHRGVYDLGGNVSEWIHNVYEIMPPSDQTLRNPMGQGQGDNYSIRGSSWSQSRLRELRLTYRDYGEKGRDDLGFRIARYAE